ncbi:MAG: RNA polymerase sigma-70 factor [Flavobacteriaceae bacterium]|nr:RNA polymerase sigma-70 factor [Flavobacteriaceae bacterium]
MKDRYKDQVFLIDSLNEGNKSAFKYLYSKFYNELCAYAKSLSGNAELAEDIVQNVMINIWDRRPNLNIKSSIKSYLYKAVYNHFINTYKQNKKELNFIEKMKADALNYFAEEDDEIIDKKVKMVKLEIENLPKKCREAFLLNKVNGLKYKEVAEELNISVKTVEAHIHNALVKIKKSLEHKKHLLYFLNFFNKIKFKNPIKI